MSAAIIAGLLAGYGIAIPIGAVGTYLIALAARTSLRVGAAAALGIATVDGLYALLAVTCGGLLTPLLAPATAILHGISAAVLLGMAAFTAAGAIARFRRSLADPAPTDSDADPETRRAVSSAGRAYSVLVAMTILNPTTVVYFTALVVGSRADALPDWTARAAFVTAAFAASASWQLLLAGAGALLGRAVAGPRRQLATALASSALMIVLAVRLALG